MKNNILRILGSLAAIVAMGFLSLQAGRPGVGELYYDGTVVRTLVPPASMPKPGVDALYVVPDQRAVAAVAPGAPGYHGGKWAVHTVEWVVPGTSTLLTSEADVLAAAEAGLVIVSRVPEADFKCPIQP